VLAAEIRIVASVALDAMPEEGVDLAITIARAQHQISHRRLFTERVIRLARLRCSRPYQAGFGRGVDGMPLLHIDPTMGDDVYPAWRIGSLLRPAAESIDQGPRFGADDRRGASGDCRHGALLATNWFCGVTSIPAISSRSPAMCRR